MIGWFFAFLTGSSLPYFIWTIGDVFNSFSPEYSPEETRDRVRVILMTIIGLCVFLILTATLQYSILTGVSAKITARIKLKYLEAILR